jgi:hypothetical protein
MQNYGKIQRLIVLIILNIIVLILVVVSSSFTCAQILQTLHQKTLYEIAKYTPTQNAYIPVGKRAWGVGVDGNVLTGTSTIYVANYGDNTVSVIDGNNNTKIGKDIPPMTM